MDEGKDYKDYLNPGSLSVLTAAKAEPALSVVKPGEICQFERLGYFCADQDSSASKKVFNRTVTLRDDWAKIEKRGK